MDVRPGRTSAPGRSNATEEGLMVTLPARRTTTLAPMREFARMQDRMRRLFDEPFTLSFPSEPVGVMPAVDIAENEGNVLVTAELPGMKKDDVDVDLSEGILTISGEKKEETEREQQDMHIVERTYGSFRRSFTLPCAVDEENVKAEFADGVLRVTLPRVEKPKGKKIQIGG
jgi:HSP20 family protein